MRLWYGHWRTELMTFCGTSNLRKLCNISSFKLSKDKILFPIQNVLVAPSILMLGETSMEWNLFNFWSTIHYRNWFFQKNFFFSTYDHSPSIFEVKQKIIRLKFVLFWGAAHSGDCKYVLIRIFLKCICPFSFQDWRTCSSNFFF